MAGNTPLAEWNGRRVWLVGASTGIGAALASALAQRGAWLALSAREPQRLAAQAASLPRARALPLNVREPAQLVAAQREIEREWGGVDVAIFNAGTYAPVRAWELEPGEGRAMFETNLFGVIDGVAAVLPGMLARGAGHIVIVGSASAYHGLPKALLYGPGKAALNSFAESLYLDLAERKIGVSIVNPGFVRTPLTAQNDFHMPALLEPEDAAHEILRGLARGEFEIHFPKRFTRALKFLRMLPRRFSLPLIRRMVRT